MSKKNPLLVITIVGGTIWFLIGMGGMGFVITGVVCKTLHLPYANELLLIGLIISILLMIISIIVSLIIVIISTNKDYKKQIDKNTNKKELEREKN
tara:strand:- start:635 stop:922 length:288 start_codon:yes stop_codon:yes gene_type:complete